MSFWKKRKRQPVVRTLEQRLYDGCYFYWRGWDKEAREELEAVAKSVTRRHYNKHGENGRTNDRSTEEKAQPDSAIKKRQRDRVARPVG
ncbi:MAG: hypothetical protein Unbinned2691contig1000_44 [Prokaryotic dsDNA virus sp.]|nr:MAG: hypothetical protein Unbinned2691contig1000_44 [Prokaryotic dsDNA virus sp.]